MACTYRMKDAAGAWQTITGKPAMMAALADGRLDHLLPAGVLKAMTTPTAAPKPTAAPRPAPAPTPNTIFTEDAAAKARELLRRKLAQMNSGLDPEMLQAGITLAGYHIEKGARSFAAYAEAMLADLGDAVRPYLKSWYMGVKYDPRAAGFDGMDTAATVEAADENEINKEREDAPSTDGSVERNRQEPASERAVGDAVQDEGRGAGEGARDAGGQARRGGRGGQPDGAGVPADRAAAGGERGDQQLPAGNPADLLEDIAAGSRFRERGSDTGFDGVSADPIPASQVEAAAGAGAAIVPRIAQQRAAEKLTVVPGDLENIRATLPYLLPEQQEDVLKAEQRLSKPDGYGMLFTNGTGTGKAQPLDAKLMTPHGWKLMGDIRLGDEVIGVDGKPTRVLAVYPQGLKPIYRVTFSDGAATECCDDHLWETQTLYARRKARSNAEWPCAQSRVRSLAEIRTTLDAQHFIPVAAPLELEAASLALPPYIMGALLGDGCITQNTITFTTADPEIADRVTRDLPDSMELRLIANGKRCPQYRISLREQVRRINGQMEQHPWLRALRDMGLHGANSASKFVPAAYLNGSIDQRVALLQGLMDTDGWLDNKSRSPYFTSVSKALADAVAYLARSLGGTATINQKRTSYDHKGERLIGQPAYNVCLNLPAGIAPFALPRKAGFYRANTKYPPRRRIVEVELVGTKLAQCIAVDHPRHLYVTDDCIVTHNTFTGLGVVKRAVRQGKTNILIAVPSDKIAADWIESGVPLGLEITKLKDTKDAGRGIVVTTYANLGANDALASREWDMVVADEAHKLMQAEDGTPTTYLENLRAITLHPDGAHQRYAMLNREDIDRMKALSSQIDFNNRIANADDTMDEHRAALIKENAGLEKEHKALADKLAQAREEVRGYVAERQGAARPRLVALSATPFAYMKTVDWANGYLFDYHEGQPEDGASGTGGRPYNSGNNRERFFMQHFGYSMRTNKLTDPDPTKVDVGLLQRQFNAWLKKKGSLSGRQLEVNADYDRRFVLVDSAIGNQIDEALNWLSENARNAPKDDRSFYELRDRINDQFDYLNRRYLLEAIKATEAIPIVKAHMAMGRKVIVFHDYLQGGGFNPFNVPQMTVSADASAEDRARADQFNAALRQFNAKFSTLVNAPLGKMSSPIEVFKRELPQVLLINGSENPKEKLKRYKVFQDDASGPQVMLVQSAQNAGWSGHDTTGKHQRVLINIGQPTAPTMAIQQEGRIYRVGQVSNAIMRYLNTGTSWEKWAFAQTIATRASAAENLGAGELSRALKDSFIAAFEESDAYPPGHEGEGTGGKERDKAQNNALTAYDRAKTFYWATQKKNGRTKAQEGVDYFATPEPVGFKMVEWLGLRGGEDALEPSGGHGAIARWLPDSVQRTVIEPSPALRSRLAMVMDLGNDRIIDGTFEELANVNKFDGIVMNPPFGVGGKTAIEHLAKAAAHLRDGGRIVALIPTGPAADKRFEKWMNGEETRPAKPVARDFLKGYPEIYQGDTVTYTDVLGNTKTGKVTSRTGDRLYVRGEGATISTSVTQFAIKAIDPTGLRTDTFRPAEGLHQVAEVRLPQVTFERAGTAVATRIVVIDKHRDPTKAPKPRSMIDLTGISDIRELFDRLESMDLPARAMTAEREALAKAEAPATQPATMPAPAEQGATEAAASQSPMIERKDRPIIKHVTKTGKTLRGIVATDITKEQAQEIDPYTFKKDGGWFIRERHVQASMGADVASVASTGITAEALPGLFAERFPKLAGAVEQMMARGARGEKGGLVVLDTNDEVEIAREVSRRTGISLGETVSWFNSGDGQYINAFYERVSGVTFLIGPNLTRENVPALVMHEAVHSQRRERINRQAMALVKGRESETDPDLRAFLDRVAKRMIDVDESENENEAASYIVELAVQEGRKSGFATTEGPMLAWIERNIGKPVADIVRGFVAAVRAWALAHGVPLKSVTVDDLVAYAQAGVRKAAKGRVLTTSGAQGAMSKSPDSEGIQFSRSGTLRTATRAATDALADTFTAPGKLSWWHKTMGTMYNLAERSPYFAPVFRAAQGFIDDVSHYANDAADLAPKLLPKLDNWRDIWKSPISAADNTAIAKPIFEGTLMWRRDENGKPVRVAEGEDVGSAGIVWHDTELRSMFGLNDAQVALYREFRAATNRSLDSMARADMLRYGGKDAKAVREQVMDARDLTAATSILRQHFRDLALADPERAEMLTATIQGFDDRAGRAKALMGKGYAPLSRFGRYSVDVVRNGKREYFGLFETAREANQMAARMRREFGIASVTQGTLSQEAFKMFAGITPETLELFGNALGLDSTGDEARDKAFQEYLRLTKSNRSAMKRMIHRQGIAGYSEDVARVLASFVYSNARQTAAGLNIGDLGEAVQAIPKEQGELKDVAFGLADYVKNPQEEAQAIRGLLFAQYLGGSIASAFVNMTQPAAVTFPWLSQFGGAKAAAAQLAKAAADTAKKRYEPDLARALRLAEEDGTVSPQEVHQLMAQAQGSGALRAGDGTKQGEALALASNGLKRMAFAWGKVFGMAEQVNRRVTFIAAYRTAVERGMDNPSQFARKAVQETQFVYSKASKQQWGRGAIGGTLMTFKTYSVAYLELLHRMATQGGPEGKRAALLALGVLMLMGGVGGLPFAGDAEDIADALARLLGYNISVKQARQELLEDAFGRGIAGFIDKGITGLPGAPLDVSGRLGMGNLIPGTGLLQPKSSHTADMLEIVGPAGDLTKRAFEGAGKLLQGDVAGAALQVAPTAVRNAAKGVDMAATGMYRDAKGYKVLDTDGLEAALKAVGFQPKSVATIQEANAEAQQAKNFYALRAQEIRAKWARGIFEGDKEMVQEARDEVADWNRKNPEQRMVIAIPSVMKKVQEMRKSKDERIAATAPKAMRASLKEDLAKVREGL